CSCPSWFIFLPKEARPAALCLRARGCRSVNASGMYSMRDDSGNGASVADCCDSLVSMMFLLVRLFFFFAQLGQYGQVFQCGRIAHRLGAGGDVAQEAPHDFAAAGLWQGV